MYNYSFVIEVKFERWMNNDESDPKNNEKNNVTYEEGKKDGKKNCLKITNKNKNK